MTYNLDRPFNLHHNPRNISDAVAATKEEIELEALVNVVGGPQAQRAVQYNQLPALIEAVAR